MGQVVIRNLDEVVLERLKAKAAEQHKSLEQSLREILTEAARPNRGELLAEVERIRAKTRLPPPGVRYPSAEEMIREDRDNR